MKIFDFLKNNKRELEFICNMCFWVRKMYSLLFICNKIESKRHLQADCSRKDREHSRCTGVW